MGKEGVHPPKIHFSRKKREHFPELERFEFPITSSMGLFLGGMLGRFFSTKMMELDVYKPQLPWGQSLGFFPRKVLAGEKNCAIGLVSSEWRAVGFGGGGGSRGVLVERYSLDEGGFGRLDQFFFRIFGRLDQFDQMDSKLI